MIKDEKTKFPLLWFGDGMANGHRRVHDSRPVHPAQYIKDQSSGATATLAANFNNGNAHSDL